MRYHMTLFALKLKTYLLRPFFLAGLAFLAVAMTLLAALVPQSAPLSLTVGILPVEEQAQPLANMISESSEDYQVVLYEQESQMRRDILSGKLHCGYLVSLDSDAKIIALETSDSFMRPLIDEMVLSQLFAYQAPMMAEDFLNARQYHVQDVQAAYQDAADNSVPMTVEIRTVGEQKEIAQLASQGIQPLLYAVLVMAFLALALLSSLLSKDQDKQRYLALFSGHPVGTAMVSCLAQVLAYLLVLILADVFMNLFVMSAQYTIAGRMALLLFLAVLGLLIQLAGAKVRKAGTVIAILVTPYMLFGILFSGAVISINLLPFWIQPLKFLSPAWYALELLSRL